MSSRYVRAFDNRVERLAAPQEPARVWGGKAVSQTGMILPYGRGAYRQTFGDCGCSSGCGGLGVEGESGLPFMAWVMLLGGGAVLAYTLLQSVKA